MSTVLAVRAVRRLASEAGLGTVDRRWLVALGVLGSLLLAALTAVAGLLAASILGRTATGSLVFLGGLAAVALAGPCLVGTLGVASAAATHVDPSHTLFRPSLVSGVVPVLARMGLPTLLKAIAGNLLVIALAVPTLHASGRGDAVVLLLAVTAVLYAAVATTLRVMLLGTRLQAIARLRRGRVGLPLIMLTVLAQAAAAFAAPHLLVHLAPHPDVVGLLSTLGRASLTVAPSGVALFALALVAVAVPSAVAAVRALDGGLTHVERELRLAAARTREHAATAPPLPLDALRALVSKDIRRARRSAGPLVGPALATTAWGCVLASALLGLITSGLLPGRDNPLALGFQLLVAALLAIEFASTGLRPVTSPDADGPAARAVLATPGGRLLSARAKATLHAGALSAVAVATLGTLALVVDISLGGALALVALLVGGIVLSTVEHVGAPAVHPRLDWTTIEQIGGNPRAQALGMAVSVTGFVVLNMLATSLASVDAHLPQRTLVLTTLVAAAALLSPRLARSTTTLFLRRFS
ncbi:MAG: hypothetical protein M3Y71_15605 [Actinomycetota bacterium]|nr:hypothetical protein [Actinomycetota bacterium]